MTSLDSLAGQATEARMLQRRSYSYRADGEVTVVRDLLCRDREIDLDDLGRVTALNGTAWSERYAYDGLGTTR